MIRYALVHIHKEENMYTNLTTNDHDMMYVIVLWFGYTNMKNWREKKFHFCGAEQIMYSKSVPSHFFSFFSHFLYKFTISTTFV